MQVHETTPRIDVTISGEGVAHVAEAIRSVYPDAEILDDSGEALPWRGSDLEAEIHAERTPGLMVKAYREQAGLSVTELADRVGTSYPNICAIERDRRKIGYRMARKLADALGTQYQRLLD